MSTVLIREILWNGSQNTSSDRPKSSESKGEGELVSRRYDH